MACVFLFFFFFFNDTATTEIYTLSLHDALPISRILREAGGWRGGREADRAPLQSAGLRVGRAPRCPGRDPPEAAHQDRKSTRLNSSHLVISYAVFCLKKKKQTDKHSTLSYSHSL